MSDRQHIKKGLVIEGASGGNTVLDIQGTQGQLFSVTDSLSGDLFKVSDITGIPIFSINSSGTIKVDGDLVLDLTTVTGTNGDYLIISDTSNGDKLTRGIGIGTSTTTYLRNDGTWSTPPNTTYSASTGLNLSSTTFSVIYGTTAGSAAQGNDSRLSDARTPLSHTHGNITNDGKIGTTANLIVRTTTAGSLTTLAAGTTSQYLRGDGAWSTPPQGTVTSVSGTGSYGGLTLTGTVTSSGNLTLGGTPTGTWPISVTGNAGTVTNGVYTTSSYSDPSWLTISKSKVGLGSVENTALSNWVGSTSITTLGTISTGTVPWARLSGVPSSFTPSSHTHGNITNDGKIGATANLIVTTTTNGVLTTLSAGTTSQYLRGDGAWATPPNTTYSASTGLNLSSTTFSVIYGTTAGSAAQGNDSRLSDARTPLSHNHGNINNDGTIVGNSVGATNGDYILIADASDSARLQPGIAIGTGTGTYLRNDGTWGTPPNTTYSASTGLNLSSTTFSVIYGTTAGSAAQGNDSRLSDARTPLSHTHGSILNGGTITATAITPANTDYILLSDTSNSGKIERGIAIGTGTTTYLRNDGTWSTPPQGTVTSVSGTGGYGGLTLTGSVTSSGNLTLGGTPTGTWPISVTGNAATATSSTLLSALPNYVFSATAQGRDFIKGIQTSFVSTAEQYPDYGSVVRISTYPNDGGSAELYFPYAVQFGGSSMRYRLGQYSNAGWTGWKTVVDSDNYNSYSPKLDGTNATGSWAISITGSAGSVAKTLTRGSYLTGNNFNGSVATTWDVDATTTATANKIVARDASGNIQVVGVKTPTGTSAGFFKADGSIDTTSYTTPPVSITYVALKALVDSSGLTVGQRYIINDYQTAHEIPNSGLWDGVYEVFLPNEYNAAPVEPLLVTALSVNKLANECYSLTFPEDIIYYDIESNQTMFPGCTRGYIYRRIDTKKGNDIGLDYRNVKFRRWQINVTNEHTTGNASFNRGAVVKKTGTAEIYIKLTSATGAFTDTSKWKRFEWDNLQYVSPVLYNEDYGTYGWVLNPDSGYPIIPTTTNFMDYYMFSTVPTTSGIQSSYTGIYGNKISINSSSIIASCNSVLFGTNFYGNTIGSNFYANTIGEYFYDNTIGNYFNGNSISAGFNGNTIGPSFYANTIGAGFNANTISNSFASNVIGAGFNGNKIGNDFNNNTIGNSFYYNTIGNDFNDNTIGNTFASNTIGNNFASSAIGNNFYTNTIGKDFFGIDYTSATYVYHTYAKELFTNSTGGQFLKFYNGSNVLQIVSITA